MEKEKSYQERVGDWMIAAFGESIAQDVPERCQRFIEEALELVQSVGMSKEDVIELANYTFSRPIGEPRQELGGVLVTLAALSTAIKYDTEVAGEVELLRVWQKIDAIREKHLTKPNLSPLPGKSREDLLNKSLGKVKPARFFFIQYTYATDKGYGDGGVFVKETPGKFFNGLAICQRLKAKYPYLTKVAILSFSEFKNEEDFEECRRDYASKNDV